MESLLLPIWRHRHIYLAALAAFRMNEFIRQLKSAVTVCVVCKLLSKCIRVACLNGFNCVQPSFFLKCNNKVNSSVDAGMRTLNKTTYLSRVIGAVGALAVQMAQGLGSKALAIEFEAPRLAAMTPFLVVRGRG